MVDVNNKRCGQQGCTTVTMFGVEGSNKGGFCSEHKSVRKTSTARGAANRVAPSNRIAWKGVVKRCSAPDMPGMGWLALSVRRASLALVAGAMERGGGSSVEDVTAARRPTGSGTGSSKRARANVDACASPPLTEAGTTASPPPAMSGGDRRDRIFPVADQRVL